MESTLNPASKFHVPGSHDVYYVPDFITVEEEQYLIQKILETPRPKWKQLANRRLQVWGGEITARQTLFAQEMPKFVTDYPNILSSLKSTGIFSMSPHGIPNHIIMNEYESGQGIMPHSDGPAYHPVVATISLSSHAVLHYYQYHQEDATTGRSIDPTPILSLLLEPRSLVITTASFYSDKLHGIDPVEEDVVDKSNIANWELLSTAFKSTTVIGGKYSRTTRYSLTCRDVAKVTSLKR